MDPNQTLKDLRALRAKIHADDSADEKAEEMATLFQALDEWLLAGGFLPRAWAFQTQSNLR